MKIVFLDSAVVNPGDISWEPIEKLGRLEAYKRTESRELVRRLEGAEAIFTDSMPVDRKAMEACPNLKFIGVAATGYNHIDLDAAKERGIAVANVPAYSTEAVAQQTVALLLSVTNQTELYNKSVQSGQWQACKEYTQTIAPITLLAGRSMGIVGYGNIGKKVAQIAQAFGMTVQAYSKNREAAVASDVLSLHCPLTKETEKMINREFISKMKDGAILINTARGGLIDEEALAEALKCGKLAGAGLDVLSKEPPAADNPLLGLSNCWITPHIGFIPIEARRIVVNTCAANLKSFIDGERLNRLI